MSEYLMKRRAMMLGIKEPDPKKPKKPIPSKSAKRKEQDKQYRKIVREMMAVSDRCEIRSVECVGKASGLQHMKRRGANFLNKKYLKRSCSPCNSYCERFPKWALENGHAVSVHKKEL